MELKNITNVRTFVKEDGTTMAVIRIEGSDDPIFLSAKQIMSASGLKNNFSVLRGSKIAVTYYKVDEELVGGAKCTKDNTIVKEFEIELSDSIQKIAQAAAFGVSMFS